MRFFNAFLKAFAKGQIKLETDTFKALLVKSNTTADTENAGIATISDFTNLDELSGTGYARATLAGMAIEDDPANNRVIWRWNPVQFPALNVNNGVIYGYVIYQDAGKIPVMFEQHSLTTNGTAVLITPSAVDGAMFLRQHVPYAP